MAEIRDLPGEFMMQWCCGRMLFQPTFLLLTAICLLAAAGRAALAGNADTAGTSPYVAMYRQIVAEHVLPGKTYPLAESLAVGKAAARLWRRDGDVVCRDTAVRCFESALAKVSRLRWVTTRGT